MMFVVNFRFGLDWLVGLSGFGFRVEWAIGVLNWLGGLACWWVVFDCVASGCV